MSTEEIVIKISQNGVPEASTGLTNLGNSAAGAGKKVDGAEKSLRAISNTLKGLMGVLAVQKIIEYADAWTRAQNRIRVFTQSADEARAVHLALFKVIQSSRQAMDPMVQLYARMAQASSALGTSQQQTIDFTEAVGKSLAIQGVSTEQARGALLQLGQAMGMGRIRAQEFNSLNEQTPIILQEVAKAMFGASGSVAQLRQRMLDGKLTSKDFYTAFMQQLPAIRKQFDLTTPTIGQAFTVLENAMVRFVGTTNQASGMSGIFAKGILLIANNIDTLQRIAMTAFPLLVTYIGVQLVKALQAARTAIIAFTAASAANPFVAIATAIAVVVAAMYEFGDSFVVGADGVTTLRDYVVAAFDAIKDAASTVWNFISTGFTDLWNTVSSAMGGLDLASFISYQATDVKNVLNTIIGIFVGTYDSIMDVWNQGPSAFSNLFANINNSAVDIVGKMVNYIMDALGKLFTWINKAGNAVGLDNIFSTDNLHINLDAAKLKLQGTGRDMADIVGSSFSSAMSKDYIGAAGNAISSAAHAAAGRRLGVGSATQAGVDLNTPGTPSAAVPDPAAAKAAAKAAKQAQAAYDKLHKSLLSVEKELDPTTGAQNDYNKSLDTLTKAMNAGMLTRAQYDVWVQKLKDHYADSLDPMKKFRDEMTALTTRNGVNVQSWKDYDVALENAMKLKSQGITVTEQMAKTLLQEAEATRHLKAQQAAAQSYSDAGVANQRSTQIDDMIGLNKAYADGAISTNQYNVNLGQMAIKLGEIAAQGDKISGTAFFSGAMNGVMEGYQGPIAGLQSAFSDFYSSLADGAANSIGQAIVYGDNFKDSMISVAKSITSQLISALIKLGIQYAVNAALSAALGSAATATSATQAAATATAWAPAAALVSLASFGANSAPAMIGMAATSAFSEGIAMAGFETGGYTGNGATNAVAGVVHGQEFVMNADATKRIGVGNLQRLQDTGDTSGLVSRANGSTSTGGSSSSGSQSGSQMQVHIENYGTSKGFEVQQLDENQVRIIARDESVKAVHKHGPTVIANDMANPNSKTSRGLATNTTTQRRR